MASVKKPVKRVGTHSGTFHCDEALGCFLIRLTDKFAGAEIVRTRDPKVLDTLDAVLDVGRVYDPSRDRYDHHQRGFNQVFGSGFVTKLSSAGLVYKHYGLEIIAKKLGLDTRHPHVKHVFFLVYKSFVEAIDAIDNGINQYDTDKPRKYVISTHLSARVGRLNFDRINEDQSPEKVNERFYCAMDLAGGEFLECVQRIHAKSNLPACAIVEESIRARHAINSSGETVVLKRICSREICSSLVAAVMSQDTRAQIDATIKLRKLLSMDDNPPIDEVIKTGVVPQFVKFLKKEDMSQLQIEAAWALTNIASGTSQHTRVVIDHGAVPIFIHLLSSPHRELRKQVIWALGNIAGDTVELRDFVLSNRVLMRVLAQLNEDAELPILRIGTWTLSNLCYGKPPPPFEQAKAVLPTLARLLQTNDSEVVANAAWALSYISDMHKESIQAIIEAGVVRKLFELSVHPLDSVTLPILRIIGTIATGTYTQTRHLIDTGALPRLLQLITDNHKKSIKREACWTISNLTAGPTDQIQAVIDARIVPALMSVLNNTEFRIQREACFGVTNVILCGNDKQIEYIVSQGCIKPLCALLPCGDTSIVENCLESLDKILRVIVEILMHI